MEISIAIPDSLLMDESTQIEKTKKIAIIARACSIFCVNTIYIYYEKDGTKHDRFLLNIILRYLETPQYLRKSIFRMMDALKFVGLMPPLKTLHHRKSSNIATTKKGDIREGVVIYLKGKKFVDVGFTKFIPYFGSKKERSRITVEFKTGYPNFSIKEISPHEVKGYWGYTVKESANLRSLLTNWNHNVILTSKKGRVFDIRKKPKWVDDKLLVVFGSPKRGLYEILGKIINEIPHSQILNFFPDQGTETVRLEESIMGALTILNLSTDN